MFALETAFNGYHIGQIAEAVDNQDSRRDLTTVF